MFILNMTTLAEQVKESAKFIKKLSDSAKALGWFKHKKQALHEKRNLLKKGENYTPKVK